MAFGRSIVGPVQGPCCPFVGPRFLKKRSDHVGNILKHTLRPTESDSVGKPVRFARKLDF